MTATIQSKGDTYRLVNGQCPNGIWQMQVEDGSWVNVAWPRFESVDKMRQINAMWEGR